MSDILSKKGKKKVMWTGIALILLLAVVTFAGCVGQEEEPKETETVTETLTPETVTLTPVTEVTGKVLVWHGDAESVARITEDLIKTEFNKLYPNIEVTYDISLRLISLHHRHPF